jgi:preprotein translocase subunit SecG
MNKYVLLGVFFVIFVAGLGVIFSNQSVSFNDVMRALGDLSPRVLSLLALPFVAVIFVLGIYLRKKSEDRMWKNAVKKTHSKRQR